MNSKQLQDEANEEDIRPIVTNITQLIFARFQKTIKENAESIGISLSTGNGLQIISQIEKFITDVEKSLTEFENISDIASLVGEAPIIEQKED